MRRLTGNIASNACTPTLSDRPGGWKRCFRPLVGGGSRRRVSLTIEERCDLKFKAKPDYEMPTDANTDNVYEVTVRAADANGNIGMKAVKVSVINEE